MINASEIVPLKTKRFFLSVLENSDQALYYHLYQDPYLCTHLGGPLNDEQARIAFRVSMKRNRQPFSRYTWTIWDENVEPRQSIGICSLVKSKRVADASDLGTILIKNYHRQGIAKEVLSKIADFGFEFLQLKSMVGWSYFDNKISERLMHSLNYDCQKVFEGENPGNYWSLTREQWLATKQEM